MLDGATPGEPRNQAGVRCVGSHGPVLRIVPMICLSSTLYEPFLSDSTRYVVGGLQHEGSRESPKTR